MQFSFKALTLIAVALFAGAPVMAHGAAHGSSHGSGTHPDIHTKAIPTYCAEGLQELDEYGAYSRFVNNHGLIYQGGVHDQLDAGEAQSVAVGFELENRDINQFSFTASVTENSDPFVVYFWHSGNSLFGDGISPSVLSNGNLRWSFRKSDTSLTKSDQIFEVFFEDYGSRRVDDFDDTAFNILVNGHMPTSRGPLELECVGL